MPLSTLRKGSSVRTPLFDKSVWTLAASTASCFAAAGIVMLPLGNSGLAKVLLIVAAVILGVNAFQAHRITRRQTVLQHVLNQAKEFALVGIDDKGLTDIWNTGAERMYGYSARDVLGKPFSNFFEPSTPEHGKSIHDFLKSLNAERLENTLERQRKDGTTFLAREALIKLSGGRENETGCCLISFDESERSQVNQRFPERSLALERALAESKSFKRALDKHVIMAITDRAGRIIEANAQFSSVSGYSNAELIGKTHSIVNSGHHEKGFFKNLWLTISSGSMWHGEICNRKKSGEIYWVDTTIVPISDINGKIERYIAIRTDITERKNYDQAMMAAMDQAEDATKAKSQFLANMSHEIRTPLTTVLGYAETLLTEEFSPQQRREALATILDNGHHLLRVLNDILDFSKIEARKLEIELMSISLPELMRDVSHFVGPRAEEKGIIFTVDYTFPIPRHITTDPTRLKQILFNLIGNAIKFTSSGSVSVTVGANPAQKLLIIAVKDTGPGINSEEQSKLFKPFSQADTSTTRTFGGTGLGLMISKELASRLGGEIRLESREGIGSTFTLEISTGQVDAEDLAFAVEDAPRARDAFVPEPLPRLNGRVLFAEDAAATRRYVDFLLGKMGLDATMVTNGKEALDEVLNGTFDLILMDMQMPTMDGYQAVEKIRAEGIRVPIIALTANLIERDLDRCMSVGCNAYLGKPFSRREFYLKLLEFLPRTRRRCQFQIRPACERTRAF